MVYAFAVAAILITLAELGDKTQLLTLGLACRYRVWQVVAGVLGAILALQLLATLAGRLVGNLLPGAWLAVLSGVLFIGFGVWTLRGGDEEPEETGAGGSHGAILTIAAAFFLAELGDKTQIMTMAVAADPSAVLRAFGSAGPAIGERLAGWGLQAGEPSGQATFWGVWLGSTLGMAIANGIAVLAGTVLGKRLPERLISRVSGTIFILFGLVTLVSALA